MKYSIIDYKLSKICLTISQKCSFKSGKMTAYLNQIKKLLINRYNLNIKTYGHS